VDVGAPELIIVLVIAALLFGAKRLPEIARSLGQSVRILKEEFGGDESKVDHAD
jgi:sec-independent protein translocase protein TatA